nr:hypothetical protein [Tanacetum cinerariifolium]
STRTQHAPDRMCLYIDAEEHELGDLVANIRAIRILISIVAYYDYEIWQMDVKTAFLNGYLNEERYCVENSKRGSIPMQEKLKLSKSQGASTPAELKRMQNVPYASAVGSIILKLDMCSLNGGAVDWKSAKQSIFATSSAEAEYIAAFDASKKAIWVRKFISGLGVVLTIEEPINDNLADPFTKALAFPKHSEHTRNIGMLPASSLM